MVASSLVASLLGGEVTGNRRGNLGVRICVDRQKNRNQHQETSRVACRDWSKAAYIKTKKNVVVMRNDSAILSRTYVHANIPVKQKALYMN